MKTNKPDKPTPATQSPSSSDDILTNLAALAQEEKDRDERKAQEEREFAQRRAAIRADAFDNLMADLRTRIQRIVALGFDFAAIGKAQGFLTGKSTPKTAAPSKSSSGPTSHTGWFNLFRSRSIQAYLRAHPDLAARLKADSIHSVDYPKHIPPPDLESIDSQARASAEQRCPSTPAAS
jgi:hypothetical protein